MIESDYIYIQSDSSTDENEPEKFQVSIILESRNTKVRYIQLWKHCQLIRNQYLISDLNESFSQNLQKFMQENKIHDDCIILFFQLIENEKGPISNIEYRGLYKLSEYFQADLLLQKLKEYSNTHFTQVDIIIQTILDEIAMNKNDKIDLKSQMEQSLCNCIEECLQNSLFETLPVSIIYNVIQKSQKTRMTNNLLYDFIMKSFDKFYILFVFLNLQQLQENRLQNFFEFYNNYKDDENRSLYFNYLPCNISFIKELKESNQKIQDDFNKLQIDFEKVKKDNSHLSNEIEKLKNEIELLKKNNGKILNLRYSSYVLNEGWTNYIDNAEIGYENKYSGYIDDKHKLLAIKVELLNLNLQSQNELIQCQAHFANIGWLDPVKGGQIVGKIINDSYYHAEAFKINLTGLAVQSYNIQYRVNMKGKDWGPWVQNGEMAGTVGEYRPIRAIQIKLISK